ncbi:hypothetical protein niasHS_014819 [Heterodera schachtii]|uniref:J domain-containing protein n=2 Tax=Heterodera TaxID=34509 RepID=A0ABD2ILV2_HETSC
MRIFRKFTTRKRKSFYQILNVPPTASKEEIKNAYFTLSKKYHPDVIGAVDSELFAQKFMEVKEAYEVLCDDETRNEHDKLLVAEEFRLNRRKRFLAGERNKIYPHVGQPDRQSGEGVFRQNFPNLMTSVDSLSNSFFSSQSRPFYNPTEEAQKYEKEAKILRWSAIAFITFLVVYYVSLRFLHKKG